MKTKKITEASWCGDRKSVNLSIYDASSPIGVKNNMVRMTIEVGKANWAKREPSKEIIINQLLEQDIEVANKDFSIQ